MSDQVKAREWKPHEYLSTQKAVDKYFTAVLETNDIEQLHIALANVSNALERHPRAAVPSKKVFDRVGAALDKEVWKLTMREFMKLGPGFLGPGQEEAPLS